MINTNQTGDVKYTVLAALGDSQMGIPMIPKGSADSGADHAPLWLT